MNGEAILVPTIYVLWRIDENYPSIIIKYPPCLLLLLPHQTASWKFIWRKHSINTETSSFSKFKYFIWSPESHLSFSGTEMFMYTNFMFTSLAHWNRITFEPSLEIMALFVLRKLILQTHMRSHPVGLDVWFLVGPLVYFNTSCARITKALAISTIIPWAVSI